RNAPATDAGRETNLSALARDDLKVLEIAGELRQRQLADGEVADPGFHVSGPVAPLRAVVAGGVAAAGDLDDLALIDLVAVASRLVEDQLTNIERGGDLDGRSGAVHGGFACQVS